MTESSTGRRSRRRREHVPLSARPYRMPFKATFSTYSVVGLIVIVSVAESLEQGGFNWLWVVPYLVTAASVYAYRRDRVAQNMAQGTLWGLTQSLCGLGAVVLIVLPAKY